MDSLSACPYQLTWISDRLAVGGAPMSYDQLDYIKAAGVTGILNLCAEYCDLRDIETSHGFEVFYLPIQDDDAPDPEELERALEWLDESLYLGKKVLIHCRLGMGRTGTVLSAYLLRRGLGQDLVEEKLKGLRSRPTNYCQWRLVRDYGRKAGKLAVRAPSLEFRQEVDLTPHFQQYEEVRRLASAGAGQPTGGLGLCGRDHAICCRLLVPAPLIEAAYINHNLNIHLSGRTRLEVISRARGDVTALRREMSALREQGVEESSPEFTDELRLRYAGLGRVCALSDKGRCLLYDARPVTCLLFDATPETKFEVMRDIVTPSLSRLSGELFMALTGGLPRSMPLFHLPEALSGAYVQTFFQLLRAGC